MSSVFDYLQIHTKNENNLSITKPFIPDIAATGSIAGTLLYPNAKFNNGSDDNGVLGNYFQYPDSKFTFNPNCFMIGFWFKPNGWSLTDGVPSDASNHRMFDWYISNNDRITVQVISGSGLRWQDVVGVVNHLTTFTTGATWSNSLHHILFVFERTGIAGGVDTRRIYLDGNLILQSSIVVANQALSGGTNHFHTVFFNSTRLDFFDVIIDNLKIYSGFPSGISEAFITEVTDNINNEELPPEPVTPENIQATDGIFDDKVKITWNEAIDATSYSLYRSETGEDDDFTLLQDNIIDLFYDDSDVKNKTKYWYKVSSSIVSKESDLSESDIGYRIKIIELVSKKVNPRVLILNGTIDIWKEGKIEKLFKIKEFRTFQKDKIISNKIKLKVINTNDFFSINNERSPFKDFDWENSSIQIYNNSNILIWDGILIDVERNHETKDAFLISTDKLYQFANKSIEYESNDWETPAHAFENICDSIGFDKINNFALTESKNRYTSNNCFIKCFITGGSSSKFQQIIEKLGELFCADVFTYKNEVHYKHWFRYESGISVQLTAEKLITQSKIRTLYDDIINQYSILYNEATEPATDSDITGIGINSRNIFDVQPFPRIDGRMGRQIVIKDLVSAKYIGECLIERTHKKDTLDTKKPKAIEENIFELPEGSEDWINLSDSYFGFTLPDENWVNKKFEVVGMETDQDTNNRITTSIEV